MFDHKRNPIHFAVITVVLVALPLMGCKPNNTANDNQDDGHSRAADQKITNRVDIPPAVRQNLGITFVNVELRPVRNTIRIPGEFELRPDARREYHVMLSGRIDLLVRQYQEVEPGQELFYLDSPEWHKMKSELASAMNAMRKSHADLAVAQAKIEESRLSIELLESRLAKLKNAGSRNADLEAQVAEKRNMIPRLRADLESVQTQSDSAHLQYDVLLSTAATITGIPRHMLDSTSADHAHDLAPAWQSINRLTIRADAGGIIDRVAVTHQGWAETGALIVDTLNPSAVRFHADALQTDMNIFTDGQAARVVPPQGGTIDLQDTINGTITVGFQAHAGQRTVPILMEPEKLPRWAKPGVTAYLEVFVGGSENPVLAIPESTIIRDGLEDVFFRRDPNDPNKVIRMVADLGVSDGRWIEVHSGVMANDEIVLGGVYPLMLASSTDGARPKGGHFHADGTFHAEH